MNYPMKLSLIYDLKFNFIWSIIFNDNRQIASFDLISQKTGSKSAPLPASSAKSYIMNFNDPYVRIVLVCKICSKEQHPERPQHWKRHYMTHSDESELPFRCDVCNKGFSRKDTMQKHAKTHVKTENEQMMPMSFF